MQFSRWEDHCLWARKISRNMARVQAVGCCVTDTNPQRQFAKAPAAEKEAVSPPAGSEPSLVGALRAAQSLAGAAVPSNLANLAHELRTPLSAIVALSEIMRDERLGPLAEARYRGYAADIHDTAKLALAILTGGLERGDARTDPADDGSAPKAFVELDAAGLVTRTVSALVPLAQRSGLRLTTEISPSLPHLIADERGQQQVLINLISNALKFTPPGGSVVVSASYQIGGALVLSVTDSGDGMTPEELQRARTGAPAPNSLRRRAGGTGFGLPLVRALVAASGASLSVESTLGRGTCVSITFPHDRVVPV